MNRDARAGALAIVLHSHMPYVEGFGTYPFGEEWLFDAACRSYLPLLDVVRNLTMTVTPVLADQLEAPGIKERMREFIAEFRVAAAERDATSVGAELRPAAEGAARSYRRSLERFDAVDGDLVAALAMTQRERGVALMASGATHAVLPLLATDAGRRMQIDAGLRSHRRRFGSPDGFWLPECAYEPGLEALLAERGIGFFCTDQSIHETNGEALSPVGARAGTVAFTIDWPTVRLVWSPDGYPSGPEYTDFHRQSMQGTRLWSIGDEPYDPDAALALATADATRFVEAVRARLAAFSSERGRPGLVVFAIDTELLGHWWTEGPVWLEQVLRLAPAHGIDLVTLAGAARMFQPEERPLRRSSWGEGKDFSTWDSPEVADLAWAARRLELRLLRDVGSDRLEPAAARRAARELLALQASDWAFLDKRGQAGDYPYQRVTNHARALLEALDCGEPDPRIRNLAPDLSLAPLLEP